MQTGFEPRHALPRKPETHDVGKERIQKGKELMSDRSIAYMEGVPDGPR